MNSLKSTKTVVPYPVTLIPAPTILRSVKPTPILFWIIPVRGFDASDPTPIPPAPSSPQLLFQYPSKPPVVVLYLRSPFVGDEFL